MFNVLFASDDNYAPYLGVAIYSLLENNSDDFTQIIIYVIDDGISNENKSKLLDICDSFDSKIVFLKNKNIEKVIGDKVYSITTKNDNVSWTTYSRLFTSSLLPDVDKVLYLDCDCVITGSFKELWDLDLDNYYCGAVKDPLNFNFVKERIGLDNINDYINAGVLLINLKKWREDRLEEKFINFLKEHNGIFIYHDQGVLNGVLKGKILYLHPKYNFLGPLHGISYEKAMKLSGCPKYYSKETINEAKNNPVFLHFSGRSEIMKPWENKKHIYNQKYKEYASKTPFKEDITLDNELTFSGDIRYHIFYGNTTDYLLKLLPKKLAYIIVEKKVKSIWANNEK